LGLYTLFASRLVGEQGLVVALEPSQREFQRLQAHIALNKATNVRSRRLAVADREGEVSLNVATQETHGHNSLGPFGIEDTELAYVETVPAKPLDAIVEEEGLQRVDFIKIDVEGAEYKVLQGARRTLERFRPILLLELQDRALRMQGSTARRVWGFLVGMGYHILRFDPSTGLPKPWVSCPDFVHENIVAIAREGG
jgi:FkbM family methyltransferase